jgi:hypothetical protein
MNSALRRFITAGFLIAIAIPAVATWYQLTRHIDTSPIHSATPSGTETAGATANFSDIAISTDATAEILERPLFNMGRRPTPRATSSPHGPDNEKNDTQSEPDALTLIGIMRWGNTHRALIRTGSDPLARWVNVGGPVDGWTLKGIERDFIVVERASREVQIPIITSPAPDTASTQD